MPVTLRVTALLGSRVVNYAGEELGSLEDVAVDIPDGVIRHAFVALPAAGISGAMTVAIPWSALVPNPPARQCFLDCTREVLDRAGGTESGRDHAGPPGRAARLSGAAMPTTLAASS